MIPLKKTITRALHPGLHQTQKTGGSIYISSYDTPTHSPRRRQTEDRREDRQTDRREDTQTDREEKTDRQTEKKDRQTDRREGK